MCQVKFAKLLSKLSKNLEIKSIISLIKFGILHTYKQTNIEPFVLLCNEQNIYSKYELIKVHHI